MAPIAGTSQSTPPGLAHKAANATLWRASTPDPDTNTNGDSLLTAGYMFSKNAYNNYQRNAYFTYQPFNRLTNKLTARSNVYAVWITVGYFEVSPWYGVNGSGVPNPSGAQVFDQAHPDGYQLGQELGADTGEIARHRGFYIIDRTIPVGFLRGVDDNVNCILLKRFIE